MDSIKEETGPTMADLYKMITQLDSSVDTLKVAVEELISTRCKRPAEFPLEDVEEEEKEPESKRQCPGTPPPSPAPLLRAEVAKDEKEDSPSGEKEEGEFSETEDEETTAPTSSPTKSEGDHADA